MPVELARDIGFRPYFASTNDLENQTVIGGFAIEARRRLMARASDANTESGSSMRYSRTR